MIISAPRKKGLLSAHLAASFRPHPTGPQKDRWQSGRMRTLGKRVRQQCLRGFESRPVRHRPSPPRGLGRWRSRAGPEPFARLRRARVRAHDEVPCITAIIIPEIRRRISANQHSLRGARQRTRQCVHHALVKVKFPEEETCKPAQLEQHESNAHAVRVSRVSNDKKSGGGFLLSSIDRGDRCQRTIQSAKFPEEETCKSAQHDRMSCNPAVWGLSKRVRQPMSAHLPAQHERNEVSAQRSAVHHAFIKPHFPKKETCIPAQHDRKEGNAHVNACIIVHQAMHEQACSRFYSPERATKKAGILRSRQIMMNNKQRDRCRRLILTPAAQKHAYRGQSQKQSRAGLGYFGRRQVEHDTPLGGSHSGIEICLASELEFKCHGDIGVDAGGVFEFIRTASLFVFKRLHFRLARDEGWLTGNQWNLRDQSRL